MQNELPEIAVLEERSGREDKESVKKFAQAEEVANREDHDDDDDDDDDDEE